VTSEVAAQAFSDGSPVRRRRRVLDVIGRMGWGVGDQAISSLSNFALGLFVARAVGATEFGAFTLAYVTYSVVINAARGLASDPFLVRYSGAQPRQWRRATAAATGTALLVGLVLGAVSVLVGLLLPSTVGLPFVALGLTLPGLTLQDSWRFAFFARGDGKLSFLNDLVWTVLLLGALVALYLSGRHGAVISLLAFGGTASLAAVYGAYQARLLPRPAWARTWLREHRSLSGRYMVENLSSSGAMQLRSVMLGAVTSLAAVGYVRAGEILMGPFTVVLMGLSQVSVPEAARVLRRNPRRLPLFCFGVGAVEAVGALAWGLMLVVVFPLGAGRFLLKDLWAPASQLIPALTLTTVVACFGVAAIAGLRALGMSRRSMWVQVVSSVCYLGFATMGAFLDGALGTCWGIFAAQSVSTTLWWHQLRSGLAERARAAAPDAPADGAPETA
jgi:O-antigen/teichoic acid export membrane protein